MVRDIAVTVSDGNDAIASATVTIGEDSETTDADGKAEFEDLSYGTYNVSVSKTGYESKTVSITVDETHGSFSVELAVVDTITVTVEDSGENAIEGASVKIGSTTKTTDSSGECTFTGMTYDDYSAEVSAEGYTTKTETLQFRSNHKSFTISLASA